MVTLIRLIWTLFLIPFYLGTFLVVLFLTLCMNVFTIPILLLALLLCKLLSMTMPRPHFYGLMLYPTWSDHPASLSKTIEWLRKESERKERERRRRRIWVYRPWESRFF